MGRRSYTPSPPRGRRSHYPRDDGPTSLLVRNLRLDCRPDDLRRPFGQFGPLKDIYLPRNFYTGEPRGFGFVQYVDPADAAEAKYQMDGQILQGRELTVVFAEENRKKPTEMRARDRRGRSRDYDRRRSPSRYSRSPRYSLSPPRYERAPARSRDYYSPSPKRRYSRSVSPRGRRYSRERSYSHSPNARPRNRSETPERGGSPYGSRSRSRSLDHGQSPVRSQSISRSRSRSPYPAAQDYSREPAARGDKSPPLSP